MSGKPTTFIVSGLSAAILSLISAQQVSAAEKKLETVYVSATRSETAQMPVATQIKIINSEEIRLSGAKLLSEVLRTQAGIQLTDSDGSGSRNVTVSMRGLSGANNVLVLVDGRKLNNPSMSAPALNTIALKDIERIEIVQGSAGVLYGDQAVGGVINIITRRATAGEINGSVKAVAGSDNLEDYTANINHGFANGLSYNVSAQKRNADNYRDNNQSAYENLLVNLRYDFEKGFIFAEGQDVKDELRNPGSLTDADAATNPRQTKTPNNFGNQYTDTWRLGGEFSLVDNWTLQGEYSDRNEEGEYMYFPELTEYSMRVKSITPRVIGEYETAQGNTVITLGYDHIDSDYESNNGWYPVYSNQQQRSYYGQLVYPVLSKLTATLGSRFSQVEDKNDLRDRQQKDELDASEFGLNYQFTPEWRAFGRFAQSFRFANPDDNNQLPAGIEFLKPQTGDSWELGTQWQGKKAQVSYSLYKLTLNDEIVLDSIQYVNINLPDSERQGFMLDAETQLSQELSVRFNYTYTDAEIVAGTYKGNEVPFVAEHSGNLVIDFMPVKNLNVHFESVYTGSRFKSGDETNTAAELSSMVVFNAALGYQLDQWDFGFRINNITNEIYAGLHTIWGQYPQPERNYQASISYHF